MGNVNVNEKRRQSYFHAPNQIELLKALNDNFSIDKKGLRRITNHPDRNMRCLQLQEKTLTNNRTYRLLFRIENVAVQKCSTEPMMSRRRSLSQPIFGLSSRRQSMNASYTSEDTAPTTN